MITAFVLFCIFIYLVIAGIMASILEDRWNCPLESGPEAFFGAMFWPIVLPVVLGLYLHRHFK